MVVEGLRASPARVGAYIDHERVHDIREYIIRVRTLAGLPIVMRNIDGQAAALALSLHFSFPPTIVHSPLFPLSSLVCSGGCFLRNRCHPRRRCAVVDVYGREAAAASTAPATLLLSSPSSFGEFIVAPGNLPRCAARFTARLHLHEDYIDRASFLDYCS